jgi:tryptophanyl-tRNA synthetase
MKLADNLNAALRPIREKRAALEKDQPTVDKALKIGADKARARASATMTEVRKAMHLPG